MEPRPSPQASNSSTEVLNLRLAVRQLEERLEVLQDSDMDDLLELLNERDAELRRLKETCASKDAQLAKIAHTYKSLYEERKALQAEVKGLRSQMKECALTAANLRNEIHTHAHQAALKDQTISDLQAQTASFKFEVKSLQQKVAEITDQANDLQDCLQHALTTINERDREIRRLDEEAKEFRRESEAKVLGLNAVTSSAKNEIDGLHAALSQLQGQLQESIKAKQLLQEQLDHSSHTCGELRARVCALEHSVSSGHANTHTLHEHVERLQRDLSHRDQQLQHREVALHEVQQALQHYQALHQREHHAMISGHTSVVVALEEQACLAQEEVHGYRVLLREARDKAQNAHMLKQQQIQAQGQILNEAKLRIKQLEERVMAERNRRKQHESEAVALKSRAEGRNSLERRVASLESENDRLRLQLQNNEKFMKQKLKSRGICTAPGVEDGSVPVCDENAPPARTHTNSSANTNVVPRARSARARHTHTTTDAAPRI